MPTEQLWIWLAAAVLTIAVLAGISAAARKIFRSVWAIAIAALTLTSIMVTLVQFDTNNLRTTVATGTVHVTLQEENRTITGFTLTNGAMTLWKTAPSKANGTAFEFTPDALAEIGPVSPGPFTLPSETAVDIITGDDPRLMLSEALRRSGQAAAIPSDPEEIRSTLFAALALQAFREKGVFEMTRTGDMRVNPETITFKMIRWMPSLLAPYAKPYLEVEMPNA